MRIMKNAKEIGIFVLIAGLIVLFLMAGTASRTALPYDGHNDAFTMTIKTYNAQPIIGDTHYTVTATLTNPTGKIGTMYAQCSLFDYNIHKSWIDTYARAGTVNIRDNCVANEPFTQTAKIELGMDESKDVPFTITVPAGLDTANAILWCGTFERCYDEDMRGDNPIGASDSDMKFVTPRQAPEANTTPENPTPAVGSTCKNDLECKGWLLGSTMCEDGYCVNKPYKNISLNDSAIVAWGKQHSIILWLVGVALVLIGIYFVYKPKEIERMF
jgi:hypothetical protein